MYLKFKDALPRLTKSNVHLVFEKKEPRWWPRLTSESKKPAWLKIDFDKWSDPSPDVSDNEAKRNLQNIDMEEYEVNCLGLFYVSS